MKGVLVVIASLIVFSIANGQIVHYACRMRNVTIESETESVHITEMKIYHENNEHKVSAVVNFTKDVHIKNIEVVLYRCSYEKSDCENFQRWKFTHRLKSIVYMKNQMWTPIFEHLTPKLDIPLVRKNIYRTPDASLNTKAIVMYYPEVVNHVWRADVFLNDHNDKKAFIMKIEFSIFTFVERNKKRDREGTRISSTTKKE